MAFVDFSEAVDYLNHNRLRKITRAINLDRRVVQLNEHLHKDQQAVVHLEAQTRNCSKSKEESVKDASCLLSYLMYMQKICLRLLSL